MSDCRLGKFINPFNGPLTEATTTSATLEEALDPLCARHTLLHLEHHLLQDHIIYMLSAPFLASQHHPGKPK